MNRREMLLTAAGAGAAALLLPRFSLADDKKPEADKAPFTLPPLPYPTDALEPIIDKMTMEIHHDRHHKAYVDNLNKVVKGTDFEGKSIEEVCAGAKKAPMKVRAPLVNNGGGHYNHSFFWTLMAPKGQGGAPEGELAKAVESFGGLEKLKMAVLEKAMTRFGSGWAWVVLAKEGGGLEVISSPNQDNPLMTGGKPILGIDVWEHAYYLKYQNKRADYVKAWWDVLNWKQAGENFTKAKA